MNDFRIPPHSAVKLVFARKVLLEDHEDVEEVRLFTVFYIPIVQSVVILVR